MIDAWNDHGIAHLETVPAGAASCAALPSWRWAQVGFLLLQLVTENDLFTDPAFAKAASLPVAKMLGLMVNTRLLSHDDLVAKLDDMAVS